MLLHKKYRQKILMFFCLSFSILIVFSFAYGEKLKGSHMVIKRSTDTILMNDLRGKQRGINPKNTIGAASYGKLNSFMGLRGKVFFKKTLSGMLKNGNVYKRPLNFASYFKDKKFKVRIERRREKSILVDVFKKIGFIDLADAVLVVDKKNIPIKLKAIPVPCIAYISMGRSPMEGLFIPYIQYLHPVKKKNPDPNFHKITKW